MKCSKIKLSSRKEYHTKGPNKKNCIQTKEDAFWITTGYQGYSYKLANTKKTIRTRESTTPSLSVTTILFPDGISFNTGSSIERWSRKTPRLTSAKSNTHSPRKSGFEDEYELSSDYNDFSEEQNILENLEDEDDKNEECGGSMFDDYDVSSSDIEELILKSQRKEERDESNDIRKGTTKHNNKSSTCTYNTEEETIQDKRSKLKKTIRFSFSRPASPETEQIIRVDITSNISPEELSQYENTVASSGYVRNDCSRGHGRAIKKEMSRTQFRECDSEGESSVSSEGIEEDFVIRCKNLALTQKVR